MRTYFREIYIWPQLLGVAKKVKERRRTNTFMNLAVLLSCPMLLTLQACSAGNPDSNSGDEGLTENSAYVATEDLCDDLDAELYTEYVGAEPELLNDATEISEGVGTMQCHLGYDGQGSDISDHGIEIHARTYRTLEEAEENYDKGLGITSRDLKEMETLEGPWEEGLQTSIESAHTHVLVARVDNLTVGIVQSMRPFDAIENDQAIELMKQYAETVVSATKA